VEGADSGRVVVSFPVFQVRFPDRWIVVDAGFDRHAWTEFYGSAPVSYWPERWDSVRVLLRGASTVVLTHEHWDHAAGVERGTDLGAVAARTAITPSQLASLLDPPAPVYVALRRDSVPAYRTLVYDTTYALAPGVVLLRATGHSPGSQWVYVQLASGREFLLVGDLVWNTAGLERQRQRPRATSESLKEDRDVLQRQMQLARALADSAGLVIVPSHDDALLSSLVRSGALRDHADLSRRP
jgi:glyoxylase-like metal-dependent hydrolase (beta-lactamase superfamily II)